MARACDENGKLDYEKEADERANQIERAVPRRVIEQDYKQHVSGAKSSHESLRYDLIPRAGLKILAERFTQGFKKYGKNNYQKGLADKQFIEDRLNHIFEHFSKLVQPRKEDEEYDNTHRACIEANLGAIMWGCCFLAEVLEHPEGSKILINEVINF
jgi:hypothetical protein